MRGPLPTIAVLLAGAVALVGPAVAERAALQRVRLGLARCPGHPLAATAWPWSSPAPSTEPTCGGLAQVDVDVDGLRLWHPWREHAGVRLEADEVAVTADGAGVWVDAEGLRVGKAVASPSGPPAPDPGDDVVRPPRPSEPGPRRSIPDTRGIPVHVHARGHGTWTRDGVTITMADPALELDGHGGAVASLSLAVEGRGLRVASEGRMTATAMGGDLSRVALEGPVSIAGGPTATASVATSPEALVVALHDASGGRLTLRAWPPRGGGGALPTAAHVEAEGFALSTLGGVGQRTLEAWGLRTADARVDAALELHGPAMAEGGLAARIDRLALEGLVVDHRKLARTPVELDALELHGEASWHGEDAAAQLWLAHRQARVSITAQLGPTALDLRTELAPLPCQALLDAFPVAMSEMVAGTRLEGELGGHADLHLDRTALARSREAAVEDRGRRREPDDAGSTPGRATGPAHAPEPPPVPGRLALSFPFLERCTVVADDPRLDLAALSGPYRHRLTDDDGHVQERTMAPGAPGYVTLAEASLLAKAFITLEDRRFWEHDGFDREQMVGAFWHNLVQGRVSRGASTISQQAARNLWLGVDRSWGRKLQEALLTARLEATTDKARIMELYLNVIELGPGTHGVDEAARLYFGKPAAKLSVLQAIHLAALAPAPRRLAARFVDGQVDAQWLDMLREHVRRMHRAGHIGDAQLYAALRDELALLDRR